MPGEKREKKLTRVVIVHFGTNNLKEVVKSLRRAVDDHLHPEKIHCHLKTSTIEKLIEGTNSVEGESIRGICIISEELLELLRISPKEKIREFEDGLLKEYFQYPSFVCLKYKLQDEVVKLDAILPGVARNEGKILNLELEDCKSLCANIYMQWYGSTAYVDDNGYHCVYADETVNCVHLIHAGEDRQLLRDLSDALEDIANPECSCEFRRRYNREGDDIKQKILADVKTFAASLENEQNKCLIIVSDYLIAELRDTPELEEIKKVLIQDCFISVGKVPNFVLLEMTDNDIFDDSTFMPIKLRYHEEQKRIAEDALNIWFKPIRSPSESYYSSGEQIQEVRRQIQQSSHHCTGGPEEKLVANNTSLPDCGRNPKEGEMVINEKSMTPSYGSLSSHITTLRSDQPSQQKSHVTKSMTNGQGQPEYRKEIRKIDQKGFQTPRAHIPSENPDDLRSNPPTPYCQPSNLSSDGNVALNVSHDSFHVDDMPNRPILSINKEIRNRNHSNEDARAGQPSSLETSMTGVQSPNVTTQSGQPGSIGTRDYQAPDPSTHGAYVLDSRIPVTHGGNNSEGKPYLSLPNPAPANGRNESAPANQKNETGIQSLPSGTKPCMLMGQGNAGNLSSFGPDGKNSGMTYGNNPQYGDTTTSTTTTDKNIPDANENSTESPDSKPGANGKNTVDKNLVAELKPQCRKELIQRLDLPIPCVHDWRNLAGHYGVPNTTIHVWSGKMPHLSASEALLSWLGTFNPDLKIETLKEDLGNFRRRDTLKILEKHGY